MSLCTSWRSAIPLPPRTRCVCNSCHAHPCGTSPWHATRQGFVFLTQEEHLTGTISQDQVLGTTSSGRAENSPNTPNQAPPIPTCCTSLLPKKPHLHGCGVHRSRMLLPAAGAGVLSCLSPCWLQEMLDISELRHFRSDKRACNQNENVCRNISGRAGSCQA